MRRPFVAAHGLALAGAHFALTGPIVDRSSRSTPRLAAMEVAAAWWRSLGGAVVLVAALAMVSSRPCHPPRRRAFGEQDACGGAHGRRRHELRHRRRWHLQGLLRGACSIACYTPAMSKPLADLLDDTLRHRFSNSVRRPGHLATRGRRPLSWRKEIFDLAISPQTSCPNPRLPIVPGRPRVPADFPTGRVRPVRNPRQVLPHLLANALRHTHSLDVAALRSRSMHGRS